MDRIPIYDDTVPIACTAGPDDLTARIEQVERLRSHLRGIDRTPDGVLLHLPNQPDIAADLAAFTVDEKSCCAFWGFEVTTDGHELTLRWEGPPTVNEFFDELITAFHSHQPLTAFSGLL